MESTTRRLLQSWPFVGTMSIALVGMTIVLVVLSDSAADGARLVIRATARTSVLLFGLTFVASSLASLWRHPMSRWLLRNRRYMGMSFGVSHTIHYFAVVTFLLVDPDEFAVVGGELGLEKLAPVIMLFLLMATSFDRTAAMMSRRAWKVLHLVGTHFFWFLFLITFGGSAPGSAFYSAFTAFVILTMLVRLAGIGQRHWLARRRTA